MANPLTTARNKYHQNIKNSTVFTPPNVAQFIFDKAVRPLYIQRNQNITSSTTVITETGKILTHPGPFCVLDPAIGGGALVKPFCAYPMKNIYIAGYDIDDYSPFPCDNFYKTNFMAMDQRLTRKPDLIICNPPFNTDKRNKDWLKANKMGKALLPEVFADKVFELYPDTPFIMITPMGFIYNQRKKSDRWRKYSKDITNTISSTLMLPLDAFPGVEFHCCVLCFNFPEGLLKPFYWFEEKYL
jgi:hypothetical protein